MPLADYRVYWLFELTPAYAAALSNPQRLAVKTALLTTGIQEDDQPATITHGRANLLKDAAIMEYSVNEPIPNLGDVKNAAIQAVADALSVPFSEIDAETTFTLFKNVGTPNKQVSWKESQQATVAYLIDNSAAWEEDV